MPRLLTYAEALAKLIVESGEPTAEKLREAKYNALQKSWALLETYAAEGFDEEILDAIMEKKARMILFATSVKELHELSGPPKPYYDGDAVRCSLNSVPEEEMIWWSKASLCAPLTQAACDRYMKLFKDFYGASIDEFMGGEK